MAQVASLFRSRTLRLCYFVLVALLFYSAAAARFRLPGLPIAGRDAWGYFHPAVSRFAGGEFVHTYGRNLVYPGFLFAILRITGSLRAIGVAQHLLGLATGGFILLCWQRLGRFAIAVPGSIYALTGLTVAAIYLGSSRPIQFEQDLRPEAITPFFAILNILLTLVFFEQRLGKEPSHKAAITASLLMINSVVLASLKTSFLVTIFFSVVPVVVALLDRRETKRRRIAVSAAALLAAAAVLIPESILARSDPLARGFLPESLFSIHANLIGQQIDADVRGEECGRYSCELLARISDELHQEMVASWQFNRVYSSFGFDPDYIMYQPAGMESWPAKFFDGDRERMLAFCLHYYWRTVTHRPGAMLHKIVTQMGLFYRARTPSFSERTTVHLDALYHDTAANFAGRGVGAPEEKVMAGYLAQANELGGTKATITLPLPVRLANWILSYLYRPVLWCVVLFVIIGAGRGWLRTNLGCYSLVVLFLFSYNFGNVLGTAVMHSLHILRYNEAQYSFSLFAVGAGMTFLLELCLRAAYSLVRAFARPPQPAGV